MRPPDSELRIDYYRGSGPGGQHRNTSETGVRITHFPTGIIVTATESRSRQQNLETAYERLEERLKRFFHKKRKRIGTKPTKGSVTRRLDAKRKMGDKKKQRQKVDD